MIPDITIKKGDIGKVLSGQLLDHDGNAPDFTGASSAKLWMRSWVGSVVKINGATFTWTDAATARWSYSCVASDVDTAGEYRMELEVIKLGITYTFPTNPTKPYLVVLIQGDLG